MKNFARRVLFFIFFIASLLTAVYLGFDLKTHPYVLTKLETVSETEGKYVIPGGQTIGVELKTEGVLVVGLADIVNTENLSTSPAKLAGVQLGDKILEIDSLRIGNTDDILNYTAIEGVKNYDFKIERAGKLMNVDVTPVQIYNSDEIKFGFWARDDIAGIGTVTFIDPDTGKFSAIGHGISDSDTGTLIDIETGTISKANITSIKLGKKGEPGEIIGYILKNETSLGTVENNTDFGIYGKINEKSMGYFSKDLIEVGKKEELKLGPAKIYSCVNNEIQVYDIEITKIFYQNKPDEKSFVIKIVDQDLLELTNGIIQGMSGCPIIQNNKIVGAVTHVFMNDPTKGYGIYIEWIFDEIYNTH
ncbi:SpoIVB peptidase [bioreactor metagenome]|jgi:stage IV sporulation protein B|uniref:Stage IV sporulation protein B n=2 Tax=root TaxID=1 RepID=A0A562JH57_9FIRM|nr:MULTISPECIES: SpoIVB peptidase [Sedimentibacter]MEA5094372.1 SpoIVB peptidase [Sedimentibacter saalensis]TWH82431.1 stage IV sporulation protein B [Sedimentibacter saalensis]